MALGGCFSTRASWNATGIASSPNDDCFGISIVTATSAPYLSLTNAAIRLVMFCSSRLNTNPVSQPSDSRLAGPASVILKLVPQVTIDGKTVEFESGKLPYAEHGKPESLLDIALIFGIPLEHACGGNCACTTCHVWINEGMNNLSELDDDEADRLDMAADLTLKSRLGCQC